MADSILSSVLSKSALTIVKDKTGDRVANNLKIGRVSIKHKSRAMRHMKEDGNSIVDAKIIDPVTLGLDVFCTSLDEINAVNSILMDRESTYTVTTKGLVFRNMVAEEFDIQQSPEMITASPVRISFKQLKKQGGEVEVHRVVEQPPDSSLLARGIDIVNEAKQTVTEAFRRTFLNG